MTLYRIGEENGIKVYKKTCLGNICLIIICILLLLSGVFFGTTCYYRNKYDRLVEQHRSELELVRTRSEQYENIYRSARNTNRELGECLSKSTTTLSGLREQLREIRKRYEEMENLLNSIGYDNSYTGNNNSSNTSDIIE
jgi:chromosome segregation ATPase